MPRIQNLNIPTSFHHCSLFKIVPSLFTFQLCSIIVCTHTLFNQFHMCIVAKQFNGWHLAFCLITLRRDMDAIKVSETLKLK